MPSARCSMLDRAPQDDPATEVRPVAFRGAGFMPGGGRASGWIALALVIALWQLAGSAGWVNALFLPAPSAIAVAIYKLAMSGALWQHVSASIVRIGSGWVLGTVAGVIVGFGDRAVDAGARRRHHLHLRAVSDSENRAAAAADPLARNRRGAEDRDHRARRILLHRDLGL